MTKGLCNNYARGPIMRAAASNKGISWRKTPFDKSSGVGDDAEPSGAVLQAAPTMSSNHLFWGSASNTLNVNSGQQLMR